MNWLAHSFLSVFLSIIAVFGYVWYYSPTIDTSFFTSALIFVAMAGVGALVPDLDLPDSKFNQLLEFAVALVIAAGAVFFFGFTEQAFLYGIGAFVLFKLLFALIVPRHRGFVHSIIFMAAVTAGIFFVTRNVAISAGFLWGFSSHLLFDGCGLKVW